MVFKIKGKFKIDVRRKDIMESNYKQALSEVWEILKYSEKRITYGGLHWFAVPFFSVFIDKTLSII